MIILIDSNYLLHRIMHSDVAKADLRTSTGIPTSGVFGFLKSLRGTVYQHKPEAIISIWDGGYSARRKAAFKGYKEGREIAPTDLAGIEYKRSFNIQRDYIQKILPALGINIFFIPGKEADDILYQASRNKKYDWMVVTDDRDMFQCINEQVCVFRPLADTRNGEGLITIDNFMQRSGIKHPDYWIFYKAIIGDGSDDTPSCAKGVGPAAAYKVVNSMNEPTMAEFTQVLNTFTDRKSNLIKDNMAIVERNKEVLDLTKEEFTSQNLSDIEQLYDTRPSYSEMNAADLLNQLEFKSILDNFAEWSVPFRMASK